MKLELLQVLILLIFLNLFLISAGYFRVYNKFSNTVKKIDVFSCVTHYKNNHEYNNKLQRNLTNIVTIKKSSLYILGKYFKQNQQNINTFPSNKHRKEPRMALRNTRSNERNIQRLPQTL